MADEVFTWLRDEVPIDARRLPTLTARPLEQGASGIVARGALRQLAVLPSSVDGPEYLHPATGMLRDAAVPSVA